MSVTMKSASPAATNALISSGWASPKRVVMSWAIEPPPCVSTLVLD